jgi:hypothetical protein
MPRLMSFALTTEQFLDGSKTVTRRLGWRNLKPGELLVGVRKAMGLRKGERPEVLGLIRVRSNTSECLNQITAADVEREGFPDMAPLHGRPFVERADRGFIQVDGQAYAAQVEARWVGNWCWDGYRMPELEAFFLLCDVARSGHWVLESGTETAWRFWQAAQGKGSSDGGRDGGVFGAAGGDVDAGHGGVA